MFLEMIIWCWILCINHQSNSVWWQRYWASIQSFCVFIMTSWPFCFHSWLEQWQSSQERKQRSPYCIKLVTYLKHHVTVRADIFMDSTTCSFTNWLNIRFWSGVVRTVIDIFVSSGIMTCRANDDSISCNHFGKCTFVAYYAPEVCS